MSTLFGEMSFNLVHMVHGIFHVSDTKRNNGSKIYISFSKSTFFIISMVYFCGGIKE
jgi:hypothetical protein